MGLPIPGGAAAAEAPGSCPPAGPRLGRPPETETGAWPAENHGSRLASPALPLPGGEDAIMGLSPPDAAAFAMEAVDAVVPAAFAAAVAALRAELRAELARQRAAGTGTATMGAHFGGQLAELDAQVHAMGGSD